MFIDRLALGFLAPFISRDLALSNFQLGLLSSAFSLTYAVFGYVIGGLSDRTGKRRAFLIACTLAFSLLSAGAGLVQTFIHLVIVRLLLGIVEGPVLPMLQSVMIPHSSAHRRGFNVGFLQNVAPFLLGQLASPVVVTQLATISSWRDTFFLTAVPGLLIVPVLHRLLRRDSVGPASLTPAYTDHQEQVRLLKIRNVVLCVGLAACTGTWVLLLNTFLPLYLVKVASYSPTEMGYLMGLLGAGGCIASLILPTLSDRIGRKPVLRVGFGFGLLTPLGALLAPHSVVALTTAAVGLGACVLGCTPLTISIVPSDVVPSGSLARAIGLTSASSAIIGGVVMPAVAGHLADQHGLQAPLWISLVAMIIGTAIATGLQTTRVGRIEAHSLWTS